MTSQASNTEAVARTTDPPASQSLTASTEPTERATPNSPWASVQATPAEAPSATNVAKAGQQQLAVVTDQADPPSKAQGVAERDPLAYPEVAQGFEQPVEVASNAEDIDEQGWRQIFKINQLLHGFQIRQENQDVIRARKNAFELNSADRSPAGSFTPTFQVDDSTLVEVYETKNDLQRSLARNAFSKRSIETNLSAGDFGVEIGPLWRREGDKTKMAEVWTESQVQEYYAAYIFPRVRIFLDDEELQISGDCVKELKALEIDRSFPSLQRFYRRFGHVFVTSVLLGGQQKTTKFAGAIDQQDNAKQQDAIRWAVGAKVNAPYVNAGAQYSREKGMGEASTQSDYVNSSYLALSATGGDTLIGSDIPKWAPTIAPYKNWRVVKNEIALPIQEVIGAMQGWEHVPRLFREIYEDRPVADRPWKGRLSLWVEDEPLFWDRTWRRLVLRSASTQGSKKAVFRVVTPGIPEIPLETMTSWQQFVLRSAFPDSNNDDMHVEWAVARDWPLRPGPDPGHDPERQHQFSFRPVSSLVISAQSQEAPIVVKSGALVRFCYHTLPVSASMVTLPHATPEPLTSMAQLKLGYSEEVRNPTSAGGKAPKSLHFPILPNLLAQQIRMNLTSLWKGRGWEGIFGRANAVGVIFGRTGAVSLRYSDTSSSSQAIFIAMETETRLVFPSPAAKEIPTVRQGDQVRPSSYIAEGKKAWIDSLLKYYPPSSKSIYVDMGDSGKLWLTFEEHGTPTTFRIVFE